MGRSLDEKLLVFGKCKARNPGTSEISLRGRDFLGSAFIRPLALGEHEPSVGWFPLRHLPNNHLPFFTIPTRRTPSTPPFVEDASPLIPQLFSSLMPKGGCDRLRAFDLKYHGPTIPISSRVILYTTKCHHPDLLSQESFLRNCS